MSFTRFELLVLRFIKLWIQVRIYGWHEPTAKKLYEEIVYAIAPKVEPPIDEGE